MRTMFAWARNPPKQSPTKYFSSKKTFKIASPSKSYAQIHPSSYARKTSNTTENVKPLAKNS